MRYCTARHLRPHSQEVSRNPGSAKRLAGEQIPRHPEVGAVNVNGMFANAFAVPLPSRRRTAGVLGGTTRAD
jgi:hypothetical protein